MTLSGSLRGKCSSRLPLPGMGMCWGGLKMEVQNFLPVGACGHCLVDVTNAGPS